MSHRRSDIRGAVATLITGTKAFVTVGHNRVHRLQDNQLPAAIIYPFREKNEPMTLGRTLKRSLALAIEIRVAATDTLDDRIDALCLTVETAMGLDPTLGRLALDSVLDDTQIGVNGEGELRQGVALLTYGVTYLTTAGVPTA